ncbi:MAG: hypothetical protein V1655_02780 [bacterium]
MTKKTTKNLIACFFIIFFTFIHFFNSIFFNKYGYAPITENFKYILLPVDIIISLIGKIIYVTFPSILSTIFGGIIGLLLSLSYYYLLAHLIVLAYDFFKNKER